MRNSGKRIISILPFTLAVVLTLSLAGCSSNGTSGTGDAEAALVRIGVLRIDDSIPLFVAGRDGLFEQKGVRVELIGFGSPMDQMRAAEAGEIDFLMTDMVVLSLLKLGQADFRVVQTALGANAAEGRFLVVSAPNSGILQPEDLHGATIAISENTMMDFLVEQFERVLGLDGTRIGKLHIPSLSLRMEALLEGRVDAAILPDPLAAFAVHMGANTVIDTTKLDENLSQSVFAVSKRLIDENPDLVQRLVGAVLQAMEAINDNPDLYREYCLEIANVPHEIAGGYPVPTYSPDTVPNREEVQRVMDWMVSRGLISEAFEYEEVVDSRFITPRN